VIRRLSLVSETGLVPIADRLRYMRLFRVVLVAATIGYWWAVPAARALPAPALAAVTTGYLALAELAGQGWRLRRSVAVSLFGLTLLVDGVYLAVVAYSPADPLTPLRYLVLADVIAVTLLASFRTGLKLAVWHTLLVWLDVQLRGSGVLGTVTDITRLTPRLVAFTAILWLVAYCTATYAAVNERVLRRHNYDLAALTRLAWRLEQVTRADQVATVLLTAAADDFLLRRVALVQLTPGGRPAVWAGPGMPSAESPPAAEPEEARVRPDQDALVLAALRDRTTLLVSRPDPARDPWLATAFPDSRNLALLPMYADEQAIAVLCFEYGQRRGSRVEQRVIGALERFAGYGALALANAVLLEQLSRHATLDGLTGAANRRTLETRLAADTAQAAEAGTELSLLLFDVDHFKQVNDRHGHAVGDDVLRHLVTTTAQLCRPQDLLARYGGEEFVLLLPATGPAAAWEVAERLRTGLIASEPPVPVTVSIGIGTAPAGGTTGASLLEAADGALYQAKRAGRNRTVASRPPAAGHLGAGAADELHLAGVELPGAAR
jgi:diguanylate cyclase (GGDEF)-like protein